MESHMLYMNALRERMDAKMEWIMRKQGTVGFGEEIDETCDEAYPGWDAYEVYQAYLKRTDDADILLQTLFEVAQEKYGMREEFDRKKEEKDAIIEAVTGEKRERYYQSEKVKSFYVRRGYGRTEYYIIAKEEELDKSLELMPDHLAETIFEPFLTHTMMSDALRIPEGTVESRLYDPQKGKYKLFELRQKDFDSLLKHVIGQFGALELLKRRAGDHFEKRGEYVVFPSPEIIRNRMRRTLSPSHPAGNR
jgi:hypothetical protein